MTLLQQLIQREVSTPILGTLSRATERIAEEITRDVLTDPAFRAEVEALIRAAFTRRLTELNTESDDVTKGGQ